ncbi:GCN5 family acetyltransferase [Sorangium cellulosum]|uniref:GCN5 family acetyltransferase n=1 Tax=Sorangium cellulosum TaxID=56 RepID=A0A150P1E6_SORCE|nr:GCN5 family acetyltransferase [Sorangium cellulosum]
MSWADLAGLVLENHAVSLRPLSYDDRAGLRAIAFDPDIWRYFVTRVETEDDLARFLEAAIADTRASRRVVFGVVDRATGQLAGSMAYGNLAEGDRRLEIGWSWLGRPFRGTRVNGWSKYLLLRHAFEAMSCERVEFKTDVLNLQARAGLRKIGAIEEGVLRSYNVMPGGRRRDAVYYSVLRAEWPAVKEALGSRLASPEP